MINILLALANFKGKHQWLNKVTISSFDLQMCVTLVDQKYNLRQDTERLKKLNYGYATSLELG